MMQSKRTNADQGARYAIYFAPPPEEALWAFGSAVLGWDAYLGTTVSFPTSLLRRFPDWRTSVSEAARYGFHATLRAPFHLADGVDEAMFVKAVTTLVADCAVVDIGKVRVTPMGRFVGLVPQNPSGALQDLAATLVRVLDPLRAPISAADHKRRQPEILSARQQTYFARWGYPFVFEEFRFHMTLSGPLRKDELADAVALLQGLHAAIATLVVIRDVCIFRQERRDASFTILSRHRLAG